jgi:hypothetical protein
VHGRLPSTPDLAGNYVLPQRKTDRFLRLWTKSQRRFSQEKSFPQILFSHIINFVATSGFRLRGSSFNSKETMIDFALELVLRGVWFSELKFSHCHIEF